MRARAAGKKFPAIQQINLLNSGTLLYMVNASCRLLLIWRKLACIIKRFPFCWFVCFFQDGFLVEEEVLNHKDLFSEEKQKSKKKAKSNSKKKAEKKSKDEL